MPDASLPRRLLVLLLTGIVAVALAGGVTAAWTHRAAAAAATVPAALGRPGAPRQPVLSARRVPAMLAASTGRQRLQSSLDAVLGRAELDGARSRSCLSVADAGGTVYDFQSASSVLPASTLKTITAAAVLEALPPTDRLVTSVRATAPVSGGVLAGDLWLVGGGDPLLSTDQYLRMRKQRGTVAPTSLEALADQVVATGLREVRGRLVGDDRRYDDERTVPTWKRSYSAQGVVGPLSALSVDDGFTAGEGAARRAAADPAAGAAALFGRLLAERGVAVPATAVSAGDDDAAATTAAPVEVSSIASPPVTDLVTQMLQESDNNTAELLLKELGLRTAGRGTRVDGLAAVRGVLEDLGVPAGSITANDGSGLDRGNRVTCRALLAVLRAQPADGALIRGLAVAGENGTLRDRFAASPARGRLRGKTGTLDGVASLVGTVETLAGGRVDFALVFNNLANNGYGLEAAEELAAVLVRYPDTPSVATLGP